jgi:hypothetical protein
MILPVGFDFILTERTTEYVTGGFDAGFRGVMKRSDLTQRRKENQDKTQRESF